MKSKLSKVEILRFTVQIIFLFLLPSLFTLTFAQLKELYLMILSGNFNFIQSLPNMIAFIVVIPFTMLFGRFFCGWLCAFGTFNDLIYLISNKVFKIKFKVSKNVDKALKCLKYIILLFIVVVIWTMKSGKFSTFSPWDAFAQISQFPQSFFDYTAGFILLALIILGAALIERFFCRYLCPLGAVFSIISKLRIFNISKPSNSCGKCRACTSRCAMGIELYKMDKVRSGECINCFKCTQICPRKNAQPSICDKNINPALGGAVAITTFAAVYCAGSALGNTVNSRNINYRHLENNINVSSQASGSQTSNSPSQKYKDGTYTGTGRGFRPGLKVSVTVKNSKIDSIEILSNNETPNHSAEALNVVPQEIIKSQSTSVDAVSGATMSSNGIMSAVEDALSRAK